MSSCKLLGRDYTNGLWQRNLHLIPRKPRRAVSPSTLLRADRRRWSIRGSFIAEITSNSFANFLMSASTLFISTRHLTPTATTRSFGARDKGKTRIRGPPRLDAGLYRLYAASLRRTAPRFEENRLVLLSLRLARQSCTRTILL